MQNIRSHDLADRMICFLNLFVVCNVLRFLKIKLQLNQLKTFSPLDAKQPVAAEYLNGGFYGGRAEDLEVALRLVILQDCSFFNYFFLFPEFQWLSTAVLWIRGGIFCGCLEVPEARLSRI